MPFAGFLSLESRLKAKSSCPMPRMEAACTEFEIDIWHEHGRRATQAFAK